MGAYDEFIKEVLPYAKQVELTYGIPTSVTLAQAIHESAGGKRTPNDVYTGKESYNLFGIKGSGDAGSVKSWTWEVINGVKKNVVANFRAYDNWGSSLGDYGKLLSNDRYKPAFSKSNPYEFIASIWKSGYATDPNYLTGVQGIMQSYNLQQYDGAGYKVPAGFKPSGGTSDSYGGKDYGSNTKAELDAMDNPREEARVEDILIDWKIPIPGTDDIKIKVTKSGLLSVSAILVGVILLIMVLYSMFLKSNPITTIAKEVIQ